MAINTNPFARLFTRGAVEGLADGFTSSFFQGAKGIWDNGGQEAIQKIIKEKMPKFAGIGITDEEKWAILLTGLNLEELQLITKVKDALLITDPKPNHRHQDRWRLVVTSMDVDGLMHRIEKPYTKTETVKDKGKETVSVHSGTDVKEVPVRMTESDPRLKHFRQVVEIVKSYGADEALGIQKATEFLHTHFLNDTDFFERMVAWLKVQATASREAIGKAWTFVASRTGELEWLLVEAAVGESVFARIANDSTLTDEQKVGALENALAMTNEEKHSVVKKRRGLPWSFWIMLISVPGIILLAAFIISLAQHR